MESFVRFSQHADILIKLVVEVAALIGFLFILRAFLKLKIYGEMRSMMAPHARLNQILLLFFTGALLIYFPYDTREMIVDAVLGSSVIQELPYYTAPNAREEIKFAAERIMSLIGNISLIRGIVQLGSYQEGGRHSLGKSVTHIVAGVCAIHIQQTLDLLSDLVGIH